MTSKVGPSTQTQPAAPTQSAPPPQLPPVSLPEYSFPSAPSTASRGSGPLASYPFAPASSTDTCLASRAGMGTRQSLGAMFFGPGQDAGPAGAPGTLPGAAPAGVPGALPGAGLPTDLGGAHNAQQLAQLGVPQAQQNGALGQGTNVLELDTGIDPNSGIPLQGTLDFTQSNGQPVAPGDANGHGTLLASQIHDVAPGAGIIAGKVNDGSGNPASLYGAISRGLDFAIQFNQQHPVGDPQHIGVVELAQGGLGGNSADVKQVDQALQQAVGSGITVVAAAGNNGNTNGGQSNLITPADVPQALTVGNALTPTQLAANSGRGPDFIGPDGLPAFGNAVGSITKPDVVALGGNVFGPRVPGSVFDNTPGSFIDPNTSSITGTSPASARVAGIVALMQGVNPNLSPDQIKAILQQSATPLPGVGANAQGAGLVDANTAVELAAQLGG